MPINETLEDVLKNGIEKNIEFYEQQRLEYLQVQVHEIMEHLKEI